MPTSAKCGAKVRRSEENAKENSIFLFTFKRKYPLDTQIQVSDMLLPRLYVIGEEAELTRHFIDDLLLALAGIRVEVFFYRGGVSR